MTTTTNQRLMEEDQGGYGATVIRTPDQRVRVFVSSTLQELAEERQAARAAITHLRLTPVLFELGARPHPPRPLYRAYLAQSDIFIGIYWQRYGWVAPGEEISGLEDEYRLSGDRPKLIYVKSPAPEREPGLTAILARIRDEDGVSYKPFQTARELRGLIENDLAIVLTESFAQVRASTELHEAVHGRHNNLPVQRSQLVDRTRETSTVRDLLLRDDVGLVTLTGSGGSGKTRLALHVAATLRDTFEDGVVWVPLASLTDPALVPAAVAQALDVREAPGQALLESLQDYLRAKRLLLLLDNFEHLLPAALVVSQLLEYCPRLTVLVTSRSPLHLQDERELPVPPLELPDTGVHPELGELSQYAAVELFIQRARDVKPDFEVTNETAPAVAAICHRLDGLPLAIELAAARVKLFPPKTLLARLDRCLPLLVAGSRDLPERQQTLRGAIDWSYDLLDEQEQQMFRGLAVFRGGFTLEGARAVCWAEDPAAEGATEEEASVLAVIESLLDKSLLWVQEGPGGEPRFGMLETIREYAGEKLRDEGHQSELESRHGRWYMKLAENAESSLTAGQMAWWLDRLDAEQDNLRVALQRGLSEQGNPEAGMRLAAVLTWLWLFKGRLTEGRDWMQRALSVAGPQTPSSVRAGLLFGVGTLAWAQGDLSAARQALDESVSLLRLRETQDRKGLAEALTLLGIVAQYQGESDQCEKWLREGLELMRDMGDQWWEGFGLYHLGRAQLHTGKLDDAQAAYREGLEIFERLGDPWGQGLLTHGLGEAAVAQHDYETAYDRFEESLSLFSQLHDPYACARAVISMAGAALGKRDNAQAEKLWRQSLASWNNLGNVLYELVSLVGLAETARAQGRRERAVELFGAVTRQVEGMGVEQAEGIAQIHADMGHAPMTEILSEATIELGEGAPAEAWKHGEDMSLEQAITHALSDDRAPKAVAESASQ